MKNMRSIPLVTLSALLLVSSIPMVAMEDPMAEFPAGLQEAAAEFNAKIEKNLKNGFAIASAKAQELYTESAPKVKELSKAVKAEINKFKESVFQPHDIVTGKAIETTPVKELVAPITETITTPDIPVVQASSSFKDFFSVSQIKETIKKHPIITGLAVAAIITVPLVIYGLKKGHNNRKQTVKANA